MHSAGQTTLLDATSQHRPQQPLPDVKSRTDSPQSVPNYTTTGAHAQRAAVAIASYGSTGYPATTQRRDASWPQSGPTPYSAEAQRLQQVPPGTQTPPIRRQEYSLDGGYSETAKPPSSSTQASNANAPRGEETSATAELGILLRLTPTALALFVSAGDVQGRERVLRDLIGQTIFLDSRSVLQYAPLASETTLRPPSSPPTVTKPQPPPQPSPTTVVVRLFAAPAGDGSVPGAQYVTKIQRAFKSWALSNKNWDVQYSEDAACRLAFQVPGVRCDDVRGALNFCFGVTSDGVASHPHVVKQGTDVDERSDVTAAAFAEIAQYVSQSCNIG